MLHPLIQARMDVDDLANDQGSLSQDAALNPQFNAESHEKDSRMPIKSDIASHYPLLERSKPKSQWLTSPEDMATEESSAVVISRLKARQDLHLPPFRSLLIAAPHPNLLLTPPDDTDPFYWKQSTRFATFQLSKTFPFPRTVSVSPREDPSSQMPFAANPVSESDIESAAPQPSPSQSPPGLIEPHTEDNTQPASNVQDFDRYGGSAWVQETVDVVVSEISTGGGPPHVINVLCHTQPCPASEEVTSAPTAFASLAVALQAKVETVQGCYIEVTHALPVKFNMARLPTSPVGTPSVLGSGVGQSDYFSMTVFAKAVVAVDHHESSNPSVPSSPHPVVPPSTVGVALLERFIPPRTTQEYLDLFTPESPSVLVDRLVELSPDNGTLIFIYPTLEGASSFVSCYLRPLLDPLLRTMVGIHELSANVAAEMGKMVAVNHMLPFGKMTRKIAALLKHISNATQRGPSPNYSLLHCSKQVVPLERQAWTEWWTHQETPRIRDGMNRYFQRAIRLPQSKEVTAGSLVREILNGVQNRMYGEMDPSRNGVEVGIYVIRRTR